MPSKEPETVFAALEKELAGKSPGDQLIALIGSDSLEDLLALWAGEEGERQ